MGDSRLVYWGWTDTICPLHSVFNFGEATAGYNWLPECLEREYETVRLLKESPRGSVRLIRRRRSGRRFILRRSTGNGEVYRRLLALPAAICSGDLRRRHLIPRSVNLCGGGRTTFTGPVHIEKRAFGLSWIYDLDFMGSGDGGGSPPPPGRFSRAAASPVGAPACWCRMSGSAPLTVPLRTARSACTSISTAETPWTPAAWETLSGTTAPTLKTAAAGSRIPPRRSLREGRFFPRRHRPAPGVPGNPEAAGQEEPARRRGF